LTEIKQTVPHAHINDRRRVVPITSQNETAFDWVVSSIGEDRRDAFARSIGQSLSWWDEAFW